jgi:hypothetical protein
MRPILRVCVAALIGLGSTVVLSAQQSPDLVTPPANILLPNYNSVPVGPSAGLESRAYVARVGDPSVQQIPSLVGVTVPKLIGGRWTIGASLLTATSWNQGTDSFTRVDLYGGTLGISGTKAGFQFSVGVNYRAGSSGNIVLRRLPGVDPINTSIDVRSIGLIYSLSYRF